MSQLVSTFDDLAALRARRISKTIRHIQLGGPFADAGLERQLNRAYFACGCREGSVGVASSLLVSSLLTFIPAFAGRFMWWQIVSFVFSAAIVGKAVGISYARLRLLVLYRRMAAML